MVATIKRKSPCEDCLYRKGVILTPVNPCAKCTKKEEIVLELPSNGKRRRRKSDDKK